MKDREHVTVIGERIRNARRRKKLSQTELGRLVGYSMNGIAKIERGESDPKFSVLSKAAEVLGMSLSELVISPNPTGNEASVERFWRFLKQDEQTLFSMEKWNVGGVQTVRIGGGITAHPSEERDDL